MRLLGQTLGNVPGLVNLTALDRRVPAKGAADRLGQRLGAVDDEQPHHRRVEAALDKVVEQRLNRGGIFGGPLDQPQRVLLARGVDADCRDKDQVLLDVQAVDLDRQQVQRRQIARQPVRQFRARQRHELARHRRLRGAVAPGRGDIAVRQANRTPEPAGRDSIWFIAHRQSSRWPAARLGSSSSCWPSGVRTRGRSMSTRPP